MEQDDREKIVRNVLKKRAEDPQYAELQQKFTECLLGVFFDEEHDNTYIDIGRHVVMACLSSARREMGVSSVENLEGYANDLFSNAVSKAKGVINNFYEVENLKLADHIYNKMKERGDIKEED